MLRSLTLSALFLLGLIQSGSAQPGIHEPLSLTRLDATHWRVDGRNLEPRVLPPSGDPLRSRVLMPGYADCLEVGHPVLPVRVLHFGLPPGGSLRIRIAGVREESFSAELLCYGDTPADTLLPLVEILPVVTRQGLRIGGVRLHPVRYDAQRDELRWARSITVDIEIAGDQGGVAVADPALLSELVNGTDAGAWGFIPSPLRKSVAAFRAGERILNIRTAAEGMYRLTFADATAAGLTDAGLDPRSFRLTLMGEELPIEVTGESDGSFDPGDAITFYAPRNRGVDGEYHDEWMDDNVFLLSWGGAAGLRRGSEDVAPSSHPGAQTITHYPLRLHFEENHAYHRGDFEHIDMAVTTRVTGEGWVWSYLLKRDTIAAEFDLPASIDRDGMLRVRARGASVDTSLMRVFLNGTVIGESRVPPYTFITPEYTVPEALLRVAGNVLRVESVGLVTCPPEDPACSIERFFVDWMQLHLSVDVTGSAAPLTLDPSVRLPGMALPATFLLNRTATTGVLEGINLRSGARLDGIATASSRAELVLDSGGVYHLYEPSAVRTPESVELITLNGYAKSAPQVDYLVISHRNFLPQARRIAEYRASADGFTILVADVEDLYTEFNHGHKDPVAIRRFVQHFRENAPDPKPQFLLIVGDASWDPKRHMASSTKTDFVPAYGNPISDNYYVSFDETEFDPWPEMAVGRIPAETPGAADAVIDKIIASETAPPQPWDNRYLFSVGGQNSLEQISLRDAVDPLIANYVLPNCLESRYIIKKTLDLVSYDDLDTLISEVNAGVSWFFFSGHGGTRVIDVGIERPDIFDNEDKYLFFVTMSCNTAHFAEPFETGLNERFVISPRNGAVAAFGTSGVGEITPDYYVSRGMFRALIDSSVRTYGELALLGKRHLLSTSGITTVNRRTVNQLCILGDPATKVPLARTPELALRSEEIRTDPEIVSEQTQTVIHTTFRNYGLCVSDSIDVLLTVRSAGIDVFSQQRRIPPFRLDTLLQWEYDFSGVDGEVQISAEIDPGNRIAERDESNNRATATLNVLPRGVTQIFPLDRAVVIQVEDETLFLIANPSYVPDASLNPRMELEISFDPDFLFIAQRLERDPEPVYTGFPVDLRQWDGVLYWRARMVTDGGPERWSTVRSFTAGGGGFSDERWQQTDGPQFETTTVDGLQQVTGGGLQLGDRPLVLEAFSGGFNGPLKQAVLRVNGVEYRPVHPDSARGFNVAVVEPRFGDVVDLRLFDTYPGREAAAEMAAFLRSIPDDHILMVAVQDDANGYPPSSIDGTNISSELKTELKQFGARMIDSVGFRDSWALIGSRATAADAKDQHFVLGTVIIRDTVVVEAREGRFITSVIGPVNSISAVRWDGEAGDDSASVDLRVHALLGERDSLIAVFPRLTPGQRALLPAPEDIPSAFVRIEGVLRDGRGNGSPLLRSLHADYVSRFPEIGITSQVVDVSADSLLEGEPLTVTASVYNAGRIRAEGLRVRLAVPGTQTVVEHALPPIEADRTGPVELELALPTAGLRGAPNFELALDPARRGVEYYRPNNVYSRGFRVGRDGAAPELQVLFDGVQIVDNDYVSPRPLIDIALRDASPLPVTDTSAVQLFLDGRRVWLQSDPDVRYSTGSGEEKVHVEYTPALRDGIHFLAVSGKDATGNAADTIPYQVRFYVSSEQRVDQVIPYPSPTEGPLDITFRVAGSEVPERARVKIYTVAGRLIRAIEADPTALRIGFNRIRWDGRDADGDAIANGVYFFKLIVVQAGGSTEIVDRFVVLR